MPKKTANSRSGAQRSGNKKKSFELVRPVSDENVLETGESSAEVDVVEETGSEATKMREVEAKSELGIAPAVAVPAGSAPKSAAARMAARRQAALRAQRPQANLIVAENYGYVRHDLIFI